MANSTPITTTTGTNIVNQSVIPFIRSQQINFAAEQLRPYADAFFYFDDTPIQQFIQPASILTCIPNTYPKNPWGPYVNEAVFCNATSAYATIIEYSQNTIAYINDNYTSLTLTFFGSSGNTLGPSAYIAGDVVYMNSNVKKTANAIPTTNTFSAEVIFWNSNTATLVVQPLTGTATNTAGNRVLYDLQTNQLSNVVISNAANKFPGNGVCWIPSNNKSIILDVAGNCYTHRSGYVQNVSANLSQLYIAANVSNTVIGDILYITGGIGIGQNTHIANVVSNNILVVNTPFTIAPSGNSTYGIGACNVDDIGCLAGIFTIPEDANISFQTGQRTFTITDKADYGDPDAEMKAATTFVAQGFINYTQTTANTPVVSPIPQITPVANNNLVPPSPSQQSSVSYGSGITDPSYFYAFKMSQTFTTPTPSTSNQNYGMFLTSVDLYFQAKPQGSQTQLPVQVIITTTENGLPTAVSLGQCTCPWEDVTVSDGINSFPTTAISSNVYTKFFFPDPIYLSPGTEYALQVYSESPDYQIWIAEIGQPIVNSNRLVSQVPSVGSLFLAQNASQWTPIQNQMLMFSINKAQFSQTPVVLEFNINTPLQTMPFDIALLHSADTTFPVANIDYQLQTFISNTGIQDSSFFEVVNNQPYNFGGDLKNSSLASNRRRVVYAGNANSIIAQVTMTSTNPDISPFFNSDHFSLVTFTQVIDPGILAAAQISITSPGNHINAANIVVTVSAPTGDSGIQATANVLASGLTGNNLTTINVINPGAGYVVSPTITISEPSAPANATAVFNGENSTSGGNAGTRYVTQPITLAPGFAAGDLQINMTAVRPVGSDIQVYFKVLGTSDSTVIQNRPWVQMSKQNDIFSPDQNTPISLTFNTGGTGTLSYVVNGVTYPLGGAYQQFQIKIAMFADDPTVPPIIQSYTAICVPAG